MRNFRKRSILSNFRERGGGGGRRETRIFLFKIFRNTWMEINKWREFGVILMILRVTIRIFFDTIFIKISIEIKETKMANKGKNTSKNLLVTFIIVFVYTSNYIEYEIYFIGFYKNTSRR